MERPLRSPPTSLKALLRSIDSFLSSESVLVGEQLPSHTCARGRFRCAIGDYRTRQRSCIKDPCLMIMPSSINTACKGIINYSNSTSFIRYFILAKIAENFSIFIEIMNNWLHVFSLDNVILPRLSCIISEDKYSSRT